jgi:HNH endonuclease
MKRGPESGLEIPEISDTAAVRFWTKVDIRRNNECWPWKAAKIQGYGIFAVTRALDIRAHRMAFHLTYGRFNPAKLVAHRCDFKACCNPLHLFLTNPKGNMDDMWAKGRAKPTGVRGEKNVNAKLTKQQVKHIRRAPKIYGLPKLLAKKFGVHPQTVYCVIWGLTWKGVQP